MDHQEISAEFNFKSHFLEVKNSSIHYVDEGQGNPVIFLHGIPTWSYIWRNIIPLLSKKYRCIAPDLIGFGRSGKPDIPYRIFDHIEYFKAFMKRINVDQVTLVLHGWGSVVGFEYFRQYPQKVKAIAFMESHIRPPKGWDSLSLPMQELASLMTTEDGGYDVIMNSNYFVNKVLPGGVLRRLESKEMEYYQEPFKLPGSCKPIWQYMHDLPFIDQPKDVMNLMDKYSSLLITSEIPKLMLYAIPGYVTTVKNIQWAKSNLKNLTLVDVGEGLHYLQETVPSTIANEIRNWLKSVFKTSLSPHRLKSSNEL